MSETDNPCPHGVDNQVEKTTHNYHVIWENYVGEAQGAMGDTGKAWKPGLGSWEVAPKLKPCIGIGQGKMVSDPGRKSVAC